nr:G2/mitotic-specific cyclin-B3-like [Leptinotarsa decemlineata]
MFSNRSQTEISITNGTFQMGSSLSTTLCTPIRPTSFTQGINELRKSVLLKRSQRRNKIYDARNNFVGDIYTLDYLEDIFKGVLINEEKILLKKGFLNTFNPENNHRLKTVNWLLSIQQVHLQFTESDFYLAINFMDHILARVKISRNIYQLLALTSLWIATKLTGTLDIDVSNLCKK